MKDIKVGDYLICKSDYYFTSDGDPTYFKNKSYKVENILDFDVLATAQTYYSDYPQTYVIGGHKISWYFLDVIFYTKIEARKVKLKNLKNESR